MTTEAAAYDVVIVGGEVYDGSGAPPLRADVAVTRDRIAAVGDLSDAARRRSIRAEGRAVAPGFIDVHAHDDFAVLFDPLFPCKVLQGVTTDVVGNCGFGASPFAVSMASLGSWDPRASGLAPWDGYAGYMSRLDEEPPALNVAVLVGHGSTRAAVIGGADRPADASELTRMRADVEEGMGAGAVGLSSGLIYAPGRFGSTDEVVALAEVVAAAGGLYATHMRNEGDSLVEAVREALDIGERAGLPVQISHHKASGEANWGKVALTLQMMDDARAAGRRVACDQYPYTSGSTSLREVIANDGLDGGSGGIGRVAFDKVRLCAVPGHPDWEGLNLVEMGEVIGVDPRKAADVVVDETGFATIVAIETMSEDDVRTVMRHPWTMIGSDGVPAGSKPHPRLYATFTRVLGRYARDEGVLTLAEAVRRMTSLPADTFGLVGRGRVKAGAFADLVVFDPSTVTDTATYDNPRVHPPGIDLVVVNGEVVAESGNSTGARPGRVLRR